MIPTVAVSLPAWERGLKPALDINVDLSPWVAPRVGAWIETHRSPQTRRKPRSLPAWERGLKPIYADQFDRYTKSLPAWERGLKPPVRNYPSPERWSLPAWERGLKH